MGLLDGWRHQTDVGWSEPCPRHGRRSVHHARFPRLAGCEALMRLRGVNSGLAFLRPVCGTVSTKTSVQAINHVGKEGRGVVAACCLLPPGGW